MGFPFVKKGVTEGERLLQQVPVSALFRAAPTEPFSGAFHSSYKQKAPNRALLPLPLLIAFQLKYYILSTLPP